MCLLQLRDPVEQLDDQPDGAVTEVQAHPQPLDPGHLLHLGGVEPQAALRVADDFQESEGNQAAHQRLQSKADTVRELTEGRLTPAEAIERFSRLDRLDEEPIAASGSVGEEEAACASLRSWLYMHLRHKGPQGQARLAQLEAEFQAYLRPRSGALLRPQY